MNEFLDACRNGNINIVKQLLSQVDPSANDNEAIKWAARMGRQDVVKLLLKDSRVDPSAQDNFAIRWAARMGRKDVVQLLLKDPRVDPSAKDNYAIRWAAQNGHKEVVELLEEHGYKIDNVCYLKLAEKLK